MPHDRSSGIPSSIVITPFRISASTTHLCIVRLPWDGESLRTWICSTVMRNTGRARWPQDGSWIQYTILADLCNAMARPCIQVGRQIVLTTSHHLHSMSRTILVDHPTSALGGIPCKGKVGMARSVSTVSHVFRVDNVAVVTLFHKTAAANQSCQKLAKTGTRCYLPDAVRVEPA